MTKKSLVLAGGGVAGIAWETGVLLGIGDAAPAALSRILDESTTLLGTSAGSTVAAQIAAGTPLEQLYATQLADETAELAVELDLAAFGAMMAGSLADAVSPQDARSRIGRIARAAETVTPAARRAVIAARLHRSDWPERELLITAIDTDSGELRVFDRASGVDLVDAVAASCAVPGIWPCVEIDGRFYMDGGMRTSANADLAAGSERVLILVPAAEVALTGVPSVPQSEFDSLAPASVRVVFADAESLAAFGANPLDPAVRRAAAIAGRNQGRQIASSIAEVWDS